MNIYSSSHNITPEDAELLVNAFTTLIEAQVETIDALNETVGKLRLLAVTATQTEKLISSILDKSDNTSKGDS